MARQWLVMLGCLFSLGPLGCAQRLVDGCDGAGEAACVSLQVQPVAAVDGGAAGVDGGTAAEVAEVDTIYVNVRAAWGQAGGVTTIRPGGRVSLPAAVGAAVRPDYAGNVVIEVSASRDGNLVGCGTSSTIKLAGQTGQRVDGGAVTLRLAACP